MEKINNKELYNKILTKFIGYITVLAIISSLFCVNIHAEELENDTHLDTYAAHYFKHLIINFGRNEENTCSYVAAGMLLSFYDSYLNDNFISKDCNCASACDCDYDDLGEIDSLNLISSPGIKREDDWEELTDYTDYNAFVDDYVNEHFHLRLLQIGRDELGLSVNHEYTTFLSHTETGHTLQCACGETRTEAHYDKTYDKCDDSLHKVYCECGYLTGYDFHSYVTVQLNFRMCSYCGYVKPKNPGPGQIIMGEEDEEPTTE